MYENQKVFVNSPVFKQIKIVWINRIIPILNGWLIEINKKLLINNKNKINVCRITRNSLIKILILGIKDEWIYFFLMF